MDGLPPIRVCVHCGWTLGEYQARRYLGCAHCYESLGEALRGEWLLSHPAFYLKSWPFAESPSPETALENLAQWREQLGDALRREDYAEAARLKALIARRERPSP